MRYHPTNILDNFGKSVYRETPKTYSIFLNITNLPQFIKINSAELINIRFVRLEENDTHGHIFFVDSSKLNVTKYYLHNFLNTYNSCMIQKKSESNGEQEVPLLKFNGYRYFKKLLNDNLNLDFSKVKFLQREDVVTVIYFENGDSITFYETLKFFEQFLPESFFRVRRDCLVNLRYVHTFQSLKNKKGTLLLRDHRLDVSRRNLVNLKRKLMHLPLL